MALFLLLVQVVLDLDKRTLLFKKNDKPQPLIENIENHDAYRFACTIYTQGNKRGEVRVEHA